ncbi:MAG: ferritin-like domain-containing protein [Deltaproteobacteria bacterium]|nr:ferritin-like domain-containing protein [Deltaproteobacteria bacterium]
MASSLPDTIPADFMAAIAHLETKDKLGVDEMKLMVLLETSGDPLYQKLASLAPEGEATDLLLKNGQEETAHAHRLKRAIEISTGEPFAMPELDENPYAEPPPFTELTPELLAGFVAGETNGDAAYQRWADNEPNPEIAALLRQNGREETRHGERVKRVSEILAA